MDVFFLFSVLITLAAITSYINFRIFKMSPGIIMMLMGTLIALALLIAGYFSPSVTDKIKESLELINFSDFVLGMLLSFLLFAGSLHINYKAIKYYANIIFTFATIGTILSAFFIGSAVYFLLRFFHSDIDYISCLLFGSLISPTDPIAVLSIMKKANLPEPIEIKITAESLFNDGVGVVLFITFLEISNRGLDNFEPASAVLLFLQQAGGGVIAGLIIG